MAYNINKYKGVVENQAGASRPDKKSKPASGSEAAGGRAISRRAFLRGVGAALVGGSAYAGFKGTKNILDYVAGKVDKESKPARSAKEELGKDEKLEKNIEPEPVSESKTSQTAQAENAPEKDWEKILFEPITQARDRLRASEVWQGEILEEPLLHAQELAESSKDQSRVSPKGALGIRQIMPGTVSEIPRYLAKVQRNFDIGYRGPSDQDLSPEQLAALIAKAGEDEAFNRVLGDIFSNYLADPAWGEGIGYQQALAGKQEEAQQYVLAAYNMGPGNFKRLKWRDWPSETKKYPQKVFKYKKKLLTAQNFFKAKGLEIKDYDILGQVVLEQEKYGFNKDREVLKYFSARLEKADDPNTLSKEELAEISQEIPLNLTV